jgi:imidazolonepropionase-like amidohydrolase
MAMPVRVILSSALLLSSLVLAAEAQVTVVDGVQLIDGTGGPPISDAAIVIENGRVSRIMQTDPAAYPAGARVVHYPGKTVIPGLIDDHIHFGLLDGMRTDSANYTRANVMRQAARFVGYGVTTVTSLGANRDILYAIRDDISAGTIIGPRILTADRGIGVTGGVPPFPVGTEQVYRPNSADEARTVVRESAARSPDLIKIWVDDFYGKYPKMRPDIYTAVIDEAHKRHLRVAAHVFYLDDAKALVNAGVDILAHSVRDQPVDTALIEPMKRRGVWYIPTLTVDESYVMVADQPAWMHDRFFAAALDSGVATTIDNRAYIDSMRSDPQLAAYRGYLAMAERNLKTMADSGVRIGFGTDGGAFPMRVQGFAEHREMQLMVAAGLTPAQVLQCATRRAAELAGVDATAGTIEPGKVADFLVLAGDPLADIANTTKLVAVWHTGRPVTPVVAVK